MAPTPEEAALIASAQQGGPAGQAAFQRLVELHQGWLVRYLYYVLGDMGDADDISQDVLLKAYQSLRTFRGDSGFRTWLRAIATRLAFNRRRDAKTRRRYEDQYEPLELPSMSQALEDGDFLLELLGALPYPYREILVLRHVEELSIDEIAAALGIGASAAKMRLKRARDQFMLLHEEQS